MTRFFTNMVCACQHANNYTVETTTLTSYVQTVLPVVTSSHLMVTS